MTATAQSHRLDAVVGVESVSTSLGDTAALVHLDLRDPAVDSMGTNGAGRISGSIPGWLAAVAQVQPLTQATNTRAKVRVECGLIAANLLRTGLRSVGIVAVCPRAVRRYRAGALTHTPPTTTESEREAVMKATQYEDYGDPDVLKLVEVDEPHAGPGEIRIAVRAVGVNAMDWKIRAGHLREMMPLSPPAGVGLDAAGIVDELGDGVEGVAVGDAVFGTGSNTYAERAVLTDWARKPDGLSFTEAAGYPVAVATAQRILDLVGVTAGQTVLISGAAGGVGSAAVQFARARDANVIATASQANQGYLTGLGATPTTYGDGLVERVRDLTPGGVDAAMDIAGSGVIAELIELTGDPSKVVSIADFTAGEHGAQVSSGGGDRSAALAEAARLFNAGKLRIPVANTFTLDQAPAAHQLSQAGHVAGRTVIVID